MKNYYDVFDISPSASHKAINVKHRLLAKQYHPDINNSRDATEKMAQLNEAYEVLSDKAKRRDYDTLLKKKHEQKNEQKHNTVQSPYPAGQSAVTKKAHMRYTTESMENDGKRLERAEQLRIKAEAKLKAEENKRLQMMAYAKKRAEEKAKATGDIQKKEEIDPEKQEVIDLLAMLHRKSDARIRRKMETDEERHHAIKVLLALVREDDSHLRRMAEEAERKQRIEEILALVKANNEEKMV